MKKALIIAGGWTGHEPKKCAHLMAGVLRKEDYAVEIADDLDVCLESEKLQALNLIVPIWTMGELSGDQGKGLLDAVRSGVGIAGFHGGMGDAFRKHCDFQFMVGGQFVGHPDGIRDYTVTITAHDDPIVQGLNDFAFNSEQYYMHVDPSNEVLATTTVEGIESAPWVNGTVMPVVWKRMYGDGRVFYSALGHVAADFDVPEALEIQRRGMLWAST